MPLGLWLAALVPSLVARVLAALGFGLVAVTGLTAITQQLETYVMNSVGGMGGAILGLLNLAGMSDALNILLGAMTARIALFLLTKGTQIVGITR